MKLTALMIVCAALVMVALAYLVTGWVFFHIGIDRIYQNKKHGSKRGSPDLPSRWQAAEKEIRAPTAEELAKMDESRLQIERLCGEASREGRRFIVGRSPERIYRQSDDGLMLCAHYLDVPNAKATVLMVHGYRSYPMSDFATAVQTFMAAGCACLMIEQRTHGESEGKYICFGAKEKYDVRMWSNYLAERFPGRPIVYDGVSMGAATVMMASGLALPAEVRAIIADCGYTTPAAIFRDVVRKSFHLPPSPVLFCAASVVKRRAGFDIGGPEADTREALKNNRLPILFAHGEADGFVDCRMSRENYAVAKEYCQAELFTVLGADHGLSFIIDRAGYIAAINRLFKRAGLEIEVE